MAPAEEDRFWPENTAPAVESVLKWPESCAAALIRDLKEFKNQLEEEPKVHVLLRFAVIYRFNKSVVKRMWKKSSSSSIVSYNANIGEKR